MLTLALNGRNREGFVAFGDQVNHLITHALP